MKTKTESELKRIGTEMKTMREDLEAMVNKIGYEEMNDENRTEEVEPPEDPQVAPDDGVVTNASVSEAVRKELLNLGVLNGGSTSASAAHERPCNETLKLIEIMNETMR